MTKPCMYCATEIPISAKVCTHCTHYQNSLKNNLKFFATLASAFSFLLAAFAFVAANFQSIRKALFWKDHVAVFSLSDHQPYVVGNVGDGDVFFSHILLTPIPPPGEIGPSRNVPIQKVLEPGEVTRIKQEDVFGESLMKRLGVMNEQGRDLRMISIDLLSENEETELAKLRALSGSYVSDSCVIRAYGIEIEPAVQMALDRYKRKSTNEYQEKNSKRGEKLAVFDVDAVAHYYSIEQDKHIDQNLDVIGYYVLVKGSDCDKDA